MSRQTLGRVPTFTVRSVVSFSSFLIIQLKLTSTIQNDRPLTLAKDTLKVHLLKRNHFVSLEQC